MSIVQIIDILVFFIYWIVLIEGTLLFILLYKKYKESRDKLALIFSFTHISLVISILFLILEEFFLKFVINITLVRLFLYISIIGVSFAVFILDLISIELTFPDKKNYLIPLTILIIACNIVYGIVLFAGEPLSLVIGGDLLFMDPFPLIIILLTLPSTLFPIITYFYFAYINRGNKILRNNSLWLGTAIIILYVAVMIELIALPNFISILSRSTFIISITIFYIIFSKEVKLE